MANVFQEQADDRFRKASAFLRKSHALIQDDLIYRSALADAVSAIKNMLQGYLLLRIAASDPTPTTQLWQETAASNRMPDLLRACADAGLNLRGLERDIRRLNNERNQRTHDDPQRLIHHTQAESAIQLADTVRQRVLIAMKGPTAAATQPPSPHDAKPTPPPAPTIAASTSTSTSTQAVAVPRPILKPETPAPPTAAASPVNESSSWHTEAPYAGTRSTEALAAEEDDSEAIDTIPARRGARFRRILGQVLVAAVLLIAGVVAGVGVMVPAAMGNTPAWLGFTSGLLPRSPTPTPTILMVTPTATPILTGPFSRTGALVSTAICQSGVATLQIQNTGTAPLAWAAGAANGTQSVLIALSPTANAEPAQFGTVAVGQSATLYVRNASATAPSALVVTLPDGALLMTVPACA